MTAKPPSGTVTFLFTDIVGSTEMWERHGDAFLPVLQAHNAVLQEAIARFGGYLIKTEGDAYKVAFSDPAAAVRCAIVAQAALQRYPWPADVGQLSVRMAVHTGTPFMQGGDYFGPPVNRTARILSAVQGGQILISADTVDRVESRLDKDARFVDLGYHTLRDVGEPARLFQAEHPAMERRSFAPTRTLDSEPHNLPTQRTSFIGREKELAYVAARLARDETPLVLLTGPSGIGKTRLSVQVAAELEQWFPDGKWFIQLGQANDADSAARQVADTLAIPIPAGGSAVASVREWLANRRCLLILDDCGHVPEAGRFIRELLSGSTTLRCLATSTRPIEVESAEVLEVPEMSKPPENASPSELLGSEAGRLFVERAKEARPDFELDDRRAKPISRWLNRVPAVPGFIEKATAMFRNPEMTPGKFVDAVVPQIAQSAEQVSKAAASRGKEMLARMKETPGLAALMQSLGGIAADRSELAEAERHCREALDIHRANQDKAGIASALWQLGNVAAARQHHRRAVTLLCAALQAATEIASPDIHAISMDLAYARRALGIEQEAVALPLEQAVALAMAHE